MTQLVFGQYPPVTIPGSEARKITSKIVDGQEYDLQIVLPSGYASSNKKYPVVYLMDSQWDLPLVSAIYGEQYFDGFVPEIIIVGITWGGTNPIPICFVPEIILPPMSAWEHRLVALISF